MNFKKAFHILELKEKRNFIILTILILIGMLLETFGISMIVPLITILIEGDLATNYPIIAPIIEFFGNPTQIQFLIYALIILNLFYLFKFVYLILLANFQSIFTLKIQTNIAKKLFYGYLKMPYLYHTGINSSVFIRNTTSEISLLIFIFRGYFTLITEIFLIFCISAFLLFYNFQVTLIIMLIFIFFSSLFYYFNKKKILKWGKERQ